MAEIVNYITHLCNSICFAKFIDGSVFLYYDSLIRYQFFVFFYLKRKQGIQFIVFE